MGYCSASDVYALVKNLILPSGSFDSNTCPTLADITSFISAGSAMIDTELADAGYNPIPATAAPYGLAAQCNAQFAAWLAEDSRVGATIMAGERTRADFFNKGWQNLLNLLSTRDLSRAGVSTMGSRAYAGGISISDRQTVSANTDRVKPRFTRGMGHNPAAGVPTDNDFWAAS